VGVSQPTRSRKSGVLPRREGWLLLAPLLLFLLLWLGFPFLTDVVYSLSDVSFQTLRNPSFIGLGNFVAAATDAAFWRAMGFSLRFALLSTACQLLLGLTLALALNPILARHRALMALILLPLMIAPALMGIMYRLMLNEFVGVVPLYLEMLGLTPNLLGPGWVLTTVVIIDVLQWTPFTLLLLLTARQTIPGELYDAARTDGASAWQTLRRVTLPLLTPALAIAGFIRFIDSFRVFDHIYVLTGGGPGDQTTSISIYIYKSFFQKQELGTAVAASMLLLVMSLALLLGVMRFMLRGART
jgi:multiple sugar transport system permease protein